ncbi:hypothetical protein CPB86DRAFT_762055 [Serendipita vermifera]|nr:hypothetical protein CPB86DRAFT_762055 [Serendipita vermifera]
MATTASRPSSPTQDLWSSILDSVSNSRSIPSKQVLLLGEPRTGKSTLAASLLQKPLEPDRPKDDFALGFDWADVRDDTDEDTLARMSVYTVQSSNLIHTKLVSNVLPPKSAIPNTLIMIVLDWTKPWTFIDQLEIWMKWIDEWAKGDGSRETEVLREEGKERLQYHLQHYTEPTDEPLPLTTATLTSSALPLPSGMFTNNTAGVPLVVVCTKADLIDDNSDIAGAGAGGMGGMVKSKGGEWEERTDGVMQVLRTICLKCGAALFYSTQVPTTQAILRQYVLHYLFIPNPPQPAMGSTDIPAPPRNPFKFTHPANALDRDRIVIPAGWDSWGKIKILRDEFEPSRWSEGWERDLEAFSLAPTSSTNGVGSTAPRAAETRLGLAVSNGARSYFKTLVGPDRGPAMETLPQIIQPTPEQAFLQQHYETLAKDPGRDPRATFRQPAVAVDGAAISSSAGGAGGVGVGVVGPLGSSSFSLPSVEKAIAEMEGGTEREKERDRPADKDRDRLSLSGRAAAGVAGATSRRDGRSLASVQTQGGASSTPRPMVSPSVLGAAGRGGQTQHAVLHEFFQSLLTSRTGTSGSAPSGGTAASSNAPTSQVPNATNDTEADQ